MKWSLTIGKIAGIKLLLHWTFWLLILWIIFSQARTGASGNEILFSIGTILSVFACVVLHEFGHALTAKKYGIITRRIILLPIGGVADLEKLPINPKQELIAGPCVNAVIAGLIYILTPVHQLTLQGELLQLTKTQLFWSTLFTINIILFLFNLIPAFPMDGGRILRALLATQINRAKATQIAANIGQFIAILFIFFGLFYNPFLSPIGIFIFFAAYSENFIIQHQEFLKRYLVKDAMMTNFTKIAPTETIQSVSDRIIAGPEHDFIVSENGTALGIITYPLLIHALKEKQFNFPVSTIMITEFESIDANESLDTIFIKLQKNKKSFLPVFDNHKLAGIINRDNINEFLMIKSAHP